MKFLKGKSDTIFDGRKFFIIILKKDGKERSELERRMWKEKNVKGEEFERKRMWKESGEECDEETND